MRAVGTDCEGAALSERSPSGEVCDCDDSCSIHALYLADFSHASIVDAYAKSKPAERRTMQLSAPSIDPAEVEQFSRIADEWWDETGKFKPLHQINPVRIAYLRDHIATHFDRDVTTDKPLGGLSLIDIGCGGGLIAEPFTRLGAAVTGLDASEKNIKTASVHAEQAGLDIHYIAGSVEAKSAEKEQYDVVFALEIIEHVADVESFMKACCALVKPGGLLFVTTINRTLKSFAFAIVGAEYVLRWLPRGTHQWNKFLRPSEIERHTRLHGLKHLDTSGMVLNPLKNEWRIDPKDIDVNFLMCFEK